MVKVMRLIQSRIPRARVFSYHKKSEQLPEEIKINNMKTYYIFILENSVFRLWSNNRPFSEIPKLVLSPETPSLHS